MDVTHRLCVQGPRVQALETSKRIYGQSLESLKRQIDMGQERLEIKEMECKRMKAELGAFRIAQGRHEEELRRFNAKCVEEAGLRSKLEATERRCETYRVRLDKGEQELGESRRMESNTKKEATILAARLQAALREASRGEARMLALTNEGKKREEGLVNR